MNIFNHFDPHLSTCSYWNTKCLGRICELSYQNDSTPTKRLLTETWGFTAYSFFNDEKTSTQAYVITRDDMIIITFRGTEPKLKDFKTDADFDKIPYLNGNVHKGFGKAFLKVWNEKDAVLKKSMKEVLESYQEDKNKAIWCTGHSLGGALATLAAATLLNENKPVKGLYTFGQPRTVDKVFADTFDQQFKNIAFRFANFNDIIAAIPPYENGNFQHIGLLMQFDEQRTLHIKSDYQDMNSAIDIPDLLDEGILSHHRLVAYMNNINQNVHKEFNVSNTLLP